MRRVISYIDGFNLYFGLKQKGWRKYYWLDLAALSRSLLKDDQTLAACRYFTTRIRNSGSGQDAGRQTLWLDALAARTDIDTFYGHYLAKEQTCRTCGATWQRHEEKMTDVNIASHLLVDAFQDRFDTALVVSGDSDLTTPIRMVRETFPQKRVIVAFPPARHSGQLQRAAHGHLRIGEDKLRNSLLPDEVAAASGFVIKRPDRWR